MDVEKLASSLSAVGTAIAVFLFASQLPLMRDIARARDATKFSKLPTYLLLGNCAQWSAYAICVQQRFDLFAVNAVGVLFCLVYGAVYVRYSAGAARLVVMEVFAAVFAFVLLMYGGLFGIASAAAVPYRGTIAAVCAVVANTAMFASPVASIRVALIEKDASRVPGLLTVASLLAGINWAAFGLVISDYFVAAPNVIGTFLSLAQLGALLYIRVTGKGAHAAADVKVEAAGAAVTPGGEHSPTMLLAAPGQVRVDALTLTHTQDDANEHEHEELEHEAHEHDDHLDDHIDKVQSIRLIRQPDASRSRGASTSAAPATTVPATATATAPVTMADLAEFHEDIIRHVSSIRSHRSARATSNVSVTDATPRLRVRAPPETPAAAERTPKASVADVRIAVAASPAPESVKKRVTATPMREP